MKPVWKDEVVIGPTAAYATGLGLWWGPAWSVLAPPRALQESWQQLAQWQIGLVDAQLRLAALPWLLLAQLAPVQPPALAAAPPSAEPPGAGSNVVRLRTVR